MKTWKKWITLAVFQTLSLIFTAAPSFAVMQQTSGPEGGDIRALAVDGNDSQIIYAGTWPRGIYKSINGGASWRPINDGLSGLAMYVNVLAIDPGNSATVYAGTEAGLFRTTNSGASWSAADDAANYYNYTVKALAIDPNNSQIIYVGSGAFRKTVNGGVTWSLSKGPPWSVGSLAIDPGDTRIIYAATQYGVYKSADGGDSWSEANNGFIRDEFGHAMPISSLALDPANSQIIYAASWEYGIFKSINGGGSWSAINSGLAVTSGATSAQFYRVAVDPTSSQIVYAATRNNGVFKSTNGGASWSAISNGLPTQQLDSSGRLVQQINALIIDPKNGDTIYAGTGGRGLAKSVNGGLRWDVANDNLAATSIMVLTSDPNNSQTLYAGTIDGLFKTSNGGALWTEMRTGLRGYHVTDAIAVAPNDSQTVYVATFQHLLKSPDGGESWSEVGAGLPSTIKVLAVAPSSSQIVYAGGQGGLYRTGNGGGSWSPVNLGLSDRYDYVTSLAVDPGNSQTVYAGTARGVFLRSGDGGASWSATTEGLFLSDPSSYSPAIYSIRIDPRQPQNIYFGQVGRIFRSTDGGLSWKVAKEPPAAYVGAFVMDRSNSQVLYAIASTSSPWLGKSVDGGVSWSPFGGELYLPELMALDANNTTIYVGTRGGGVFRSLSDGELPTVSGTPGTTATAGAQYSFTARATGATSFSIQSKPSWAVFDAFTGALSGTPLNGDAGIYSNIVISASNGAGTVSLAPFSIIVNAQPPPTISGTPPASVKAGFPYAFLPTSSYATRFTIDKKPPWAAFDPFSGALTGTPTEEGMGTYSDIVISAGSGVGKASLPPFSITVLPPPVPTISGTPAAEVTANVAYSFIPASSYATSFSITNRPSWAVFNSSTGALTGTPTNVDAGITDNIEISAINRGGRASLGAFSITVVPEVWQQIYSLFHPDGAVVAIDPKYPRTIYAGRTGVQKSSDGGDTWSAINTDLGPTEVTSIAMDRTGETVFISYIGEGIYKSIDRGVSWRKLAALPAFVVNFVLLSPDSHTVFAASDSGLFKSMDGGTSWTLLKGLGFVTLYSLALDPTNPGIIYAGGFGIYKSTDGGSSWSTLIPAVGGVRGIAVDPASPHIVYAASGGGLLKSTNWGVTWKTLDTGVDSITYNALSLDARTHTIYTGGAFTGVLKSKDGGNSWSAMKTGLPPGTVTALAIDPIEGQLIYAGTDGGLFRTRPIPVTISGIPPAGVLTWQKYSFTPSSTGATSFSITSKPYWATFDTATGKLTGTPTLAGSFPNILISGTNGRASAALPAFTVTVQPDTTAPVVNAFAVTSPVKSLAVPVTQFSATDDAGVAGYLITTSPDAPMASGGGWRGTAPRGYISSASGTRTLYAWAKDSSGNVSAPKAANVVIDPTPPVINTFSVPSAVRTLTVPVTGFIASDNDAVAGYLIATTATIPSPSAPGWSPTAPDSYTFTTTGKKSLYAWVKDRAGNVSAVKSAVVTIDSTPPVVLNFAVKRYWKSTSVPVVSFTAFDGTGPSGYLITETPAAPDPSSPDWKATPPATYTASAPGDFTLYAWVKDGTGNVSLPKTAATTIDTTAPEVTAFVIPAATKTLKVPILSFTGTDNRAVTGYLVTRSSSPPAATSIGWTTVAPTYVTMPSPGVKMLYAWVKDAAGNVSPARTATVKVEITPP